MAGWKVGQEIAAQFKHRFASDRVQVRKITKVGRKWAYFGTGRFDMATGKIDGGPNYPAIGDVYESMDAYETAMARIELWTRLRQSIDKKWRAPMHLTTDDIKRIASEIEGPK